MAKAKEKSDTLSKEDEKLLLELNEHYQAWTDDVQRRLTRKHGWNDITDAYYGVLPADWPFISRTVDPRIRTSIIEKNARLVNGKLRGRLVPREGGDVIKSEIKNAMLDHNWDIANDGGTMNAKIGICDLDARLYGSKFALVKWKTITDDEGETKYDANEMEPLDIRDSGIEPACSHIRDAKWFQHRSWEYLEDLEQMTDHTGDSMYKNIDIIKSAIREGKSSQRRNRFVSRIKQIRGLEDRMGQDRAFPILEVVTEYRQDRWITFSPEYNTILRDTDNPYEHDRIPVVQLRYYNTQDDPIGESEVEPVLPLWKAIQANMCAYLDEVMIKMRPPLKIVEGSVRIETIEYGPEAQWLMNSLDSVQEMQSGADSVRYFQTTHSALVSAFNTAMGDLSQGVSGIDPFNPEKTATEVKATERQRNVRDQKNQNDLADFIKDIMLMWCSNLKQFVFSDPKKREYILRIVGKESFKKFLDAGYADMELPHEVAMQIQEIIDANPDMTDQELLTIAQIGLVPKHPIVENPEDKEKDRKMKPKMRISDTGDVADISVVPEDVEGLDDYIPDVKSMSSSYIDEMIQARQQAISLVTGNQMVQTMLAEDGYKVNIKDLIVDQLDNTGMRDAGRYFEKLSIQPQQNGGPNPTNPTQEGASMPGGPVQNSQVGGLQPTPQAPIGASALQ